MRKNGTTIKRIAYALGTVLTLWLAAMAYARMIAPEERQDASMETVALTRQEIRRLTQLHGTNVIKIERGTVSILRDGRWIPVPTDEQG